MGKKLRMQEEKEYEMEEGVHYATPARIEIMDTQYGTAPRVHFVIVHGENKGQFVNSFVSSKLTPNSKLAKWATKLLNREIEIDEELDLDILIGKPAKVIVKMNNKGYYNVDSLLSMKSKTRKKLEKIIEKYKEQNPDKFEESDDDVEELEEDLLDEKLEDEDDLEDDDLEDELEDDDLSEEDIEDAMDEEEFDEDELIKEIEEIE